MKGEVEPRLIEALREAEAEFRSAPERGGPILVDAATDLLSAGIALPTAIALAGDDHAAVEETRTDLMGVLAELRLAPMSIESA